MKRHSLVVNAFKRSCSTHDSPVELKILFDAASGTIARQRAKLTACTDAEHTRSGGNRNAEQRPCEFEKLALWLFMPLRFLHSGSRIFVSIRKDWRGYTFRITRYLPCRPNLNIEPVAVSYTHLRAH